jgi:dienelactone hydrolase
MALSYRCTQCGRVSKATAEVFGKVVNCEGCGKAIRVPTPRAAAPAPAGPSGNAYGLSERDAGETSEPVTAAPRSSRPFPKSAPEWGEPAKKSNSGTSFSGLKGVLGGGLGVLVVLAGLGLRVYNIFHRNEVRQAQQQARANAAPIAPTAVAPAVKRPWTMPVLPAPGEGVEIEPGVWLHEVELRGGGGPGGKLPGHSGKLWLYLPDGDHDPKSLPCILIAGAGSNLITGMGLGDGDRAEQLPYVRAGFAVLAYELDGMLPEPKPTNDAAFAPFVRSFLDAEAGLVNMRVAVEFATTKVPSIDPGRLFAVGHSSAATLALLVAENEPRIAACVAFAPQVDVKEFIPTQAQQALAQLVPGANQFFTRFNPRDGEEKFHCPLLLFVALDDPIVKIQAIRGLEERLKGMNKSVVLATVPTGGHYDPMINTGIPLAIRWLKGIRRQPDGSIVASPLTNPAPATKNQRVPRGKSATPKPGMRRPRGGIQKSN